MKRLLMGLLLSLTVLNARAQQTASDEVKSNTLSRPSVSLS